ncbi:MAG: signal peptidase II [Actinobacteria bacterium]|nr:signal peptidase II [Actinomycetota bacterium]
MSARRLPGQASPARAVRWVCAAVAALWLLVDQATKALAVEALAGRTVHLSWLDLRLVRNPGGAFGLPGVPGLFVVVTVVVLVLVARALPRTERLSLAVAYGLLAGGALGNGLDRVLRAPGFPSGHVVDFIDLRWWPVFNVADIGIVAGAALVAVLLSPPDRAGGANGRVARVPPARSDPAPPPR